MTDFDTRTSERSTTDTRIAVTATALAVAGLGSTYLLPGLLITGHTPDPGGFAVGAAVTVALAVVLFCWVVPRSLRGPEATNRPAVAGFVTSIFAFVSTALFWLGVPLVVAGAGLALGRHGRERTGRRGLATAAVAISVFVVVATVAVLVNDALGHVGLGIQPPE